MQDRILIEAMLKSAYLMKRQSRDKRFGYALYQGNMLLAGIVTNKQYKRFRDLLKVKNDRFTFNLVKVRGAHGKSLVKNLYKQLKSKKDGRCNPPEKGIQIQKGWYGSNAPRP